MGKEGSTGVTAEVGSRKTEIEDRKMGLDSWGVQKMKEGGVNRGCCCHDHQPWTS